MRREGEGARESGRGGCLTSGSVPEPLGLASSQLHRIVSSQGYLGRGDLNERTICRICSPCTSTLPTINSMLFNSFSQLSQTYRFHSQGVVARRTERPSPSLGTTSRIQVKTHEFSRPPPPEELSHVLDHPASRPAVHKPEAPRSGIWAPFPREHNEIFMWHCFITELMLRKNYGDCFSVEVFGRVATYVVSPSIYGTAETTIHRR